MGEFVLYIDIFVKVSGFEKKIMLLGSRILLLKHMSDVCGCDCLSGAPTLPFHLV